MMFILQNASTMDSLHYAKNYSSIITATLSHFLCDINRVVMVYSDCRSARLIVMIFPEIQVLHP